MAEQKPIPPPSSGASEQQMRVLEDKISNLNRKIELIENNMLDVNKKQNQDLKTVLHKQIEMEKEIDLVKRRIQEMAADLKHFARKEQMDTLQKYIEYWKPLAFVTQSEVEDIIDEKLRKSLNTNEGDV